MGADTDGVHWSEETGEGGRGSPGRIMVKEGHEHVRKQAGSHTAVGTDAAGTQTTSLAEGTDAVTY